MLIAVSVFFVRQWQNLKTIYNARTDSTEQIIKRAEESKERQRIILEKNRAQIVPPSLDQLDSLLEGKTSPDELKTELGLDDTAQEPQQSAEVSVPPVEEPREQKAQELIDRCAKELYAYEVDLMADLGALKQEAVDEYKALPAEERTRESKLKIGYKLLNRCYEMEAESDNKVKDILNRLRGDLKELGADTGIADTLWVHYCEEKSTTKEYYFNKFL